MVDDTPQDGDAGRDEAASDPARRSRTPPTIELEAARVETAGTDEEAAPSAAEDRPAAPPPSRRATIGVALAAGAVAGLAVVAVAWVAAGRHGGTPVLDSSTIATLETLGARLTRLEDAPTPVARPNPALNARFEEIDKTIVGLREQLDAQRGKSDALAQAVDAVKAAPHETVAASEDQPAADARLVQLETALKSVTDEVGRLRDAKAPAPAAPAVSAETAARETNLSRAVAALALDLAVRDGAPYAAELAALRRLGGDDPALKPLDRFAETGVPDVTGLARELVGAVPQEPAPPASNAVRGGWFERLEAGAARLVKLHRLDVTEGADASATLSRIVAAARRGDLDAAAREIAALSDPLRARFHAWLDELAARDAALAAAHRSVADAVAALAKTPAP
jgi:hypothetical protein